MGDREFGRLLRSLGRLSAQQQGALSRALQQVAISAEDALGEPDECPHCEADHYATVFFETDDGHLTPVPLAQAARHVDVPDAAVPSEAPPRTGSGRGSGTSGKTQRPWWKLSQYTRSSVSEAEAELQSATSVVDYNRHAVCRELDADPRVRTAGAVIRDEDLTGFLEDLMTFFPRPS